LLRIAALVWKLYKVTLNGISNNLRGTKMVKYHCDNQAEED